MIESMLSTGKFVSVAVAFDEHTVSLVKFGGGLAQKLGKKLCLIHVGEPLATLQPVRPFAIPAVIWDKMPEYVAAGREDTQRRLAELKTLVPQSVEVRLIVAQGRATDALATEAERAGTCLLLVGTSVDTLRFLPQGFSTALSLMSSAPFPVMAVDTERHLPNLDQSFRILMADDLSEQSEQALAVAASLADSFPKSWLHHVHVSAFSAANLQTALQNAAIAARTSLSSTEVGEIYKAVHAEQREVLEKRFRSYREYVEAAGSKYTAEVATGDVGAELHGAIQAYLPDVLIFGRHHTWHKKPFFFGRMPFKAMMTFNRPVLIVPGAAEK